MSIVEDLKALFETNPPTSALQEVADRVKGRLVLSMTVVSALGKDSVAVKNIRAFTKDPDGYLAGIADPAVRAVFASIAPEAKAKKADPPPPPPPVETPEQKAERERKEAEAVAKKKAEDEAKAVEEARKAADAEAARKAEEARAKKAADFAAGRAQMAADARAAFNAELAARKERQRKADEATAKAAEEEAKKPKADPKPPKDEEKPKAEEPAPKAPRKRALNLWLVGPVALAAIVLMTVGFLVFGGLSEDEGQDEALDILDQQSKVEEIRAGCAEHGISEADCDRLVSRFLSKPR